MVPQFIHNPAATNRLRLEPHHAELFDLARAAGVFAVIRDWPHYAPTPLVSLPALARRIGVERLWVKDESKRAPLKSFKALGAPFALGEALREALEQRLASQPGYDDLWSGKAADAAGGYMAVAASDGNHGRALAWAAHHFGCRCRIYLPSGVSAARQRAIEIFGAEIVRVDGNYEDAVSAALGCCNRTDTFLIQDTEAAGGERSCAHIMQGYLTLVHEIADQLAGESPTHIFLQVGCGGLAASFAAGWRRLGGEARFVGVEPRGADCLLRSLANGRPTTVPGEHNTIMTGMAVGELSPMAWPILRDFIEFSVSLGDEAARWTMKIAARPIADDPAIEMGETGAAGLAACLRIATVNDEARRVGLGPSSRILVLNTEGAVDPVKYAELLECGEIERSSPTILGK